MGNQHIFNRNAYNSMKKRNRDAVMDIKIVMNNGVGYIRKPIPPNTYQIECVRLNETYVGRNHKSLASTRMGRFTIGPATNLLYLALCILIYQFQQMMLSALRLQGLCQHTAILTLL